MKKQAQIDRVEVDGLHGTDRKIDARMEQNTLILVGENGSGKTTFLRILYNLLAGRWRSLSLIKFRRLTITVDGTPFTVNLSDLRGASEKVNERAVSEMPLALRRRLVELLESGDRPSTDALEQLARRYGYPSALLYNFMAMLEDEDIRPSKEVSKVLDGITAAFSSQVLYLPTYRRIERELASILSSLDLDDHRIRRLARPSRTVAERSSIEFVEFGMQDVDRLISSTLDGLRTFQSSTLRVLTLKHFGDIVSQNYSEADIKTVKSLQIDAVESVLERVDDSVVSQEQKQGWVRAVQDARSKDHPNQHDQIVCHYFLQLLEFQESLRQKEKSIADFCRICSEYTVDKEFVYDSASFRFQIRLKSPDGSGDTIDLADLSSGEKQVASLFCHLYLSGNERYFVIIDEPEMSLSVPWQRRFLVDIRHGGFCDGLVAATHSPFIYDNELGPFTHAMGEFLRNS